MNITIKYLQIDFLISSKRQSNVRIMRIIDQRFVWTKISLNQKIEMIINYIITRISRTRSKGTRTNLEIASLKEVIKSLAMHRAAFISFGRNSLVTAEGEVFSPVLKAGRQFFRGPGWRAFEEGERTSKNVAGQP